MVPKAKNTSAECVDFIFNRIDVKLRNGKQLIHLLAPIDKLASSTGVS